MPKPSDDRYFGAKRGAAQKAWEGMVAHYGLAKATQVWDAMLNERRRAGKTYGRKR